MKVGDRVKLVATEYLAEELQVGLTGRIAKFGSHECIEVAMDSGYTDDDGDFLWPFYAEELELIQ